MATVCQAETKYDAAAVVEHENSDVPMAAKTAICKWSSTAIECSLNDGKSLTWSANPEQAAIETASNRGISVSRCFSSRSRAPNVDFESKKTAYAEICLISSRFAADTLLSLRLNTARSGNENVFEPEHLGKPAKFPDPFLNDYKFWSNCSVLAIVQICKWHAQNATSAHIDSSITANSESACSI